MRRNRYRSIARTNILTCTLVRTIYVQYYSTVHNGSNHPPTPVLNLTSSLVIYWCSDRTVPLLHQQQFDIALNTISLYDHLLSTLGPFLLPPGKRTIKSVAAYNDGRQSNIVTKVCITESNFKINSQCSCSFVLACSGYRWGLDIGQILMECYVNVTL